MMGEFMLTLESLEIMYINISFCEYCPPDETFCQILHFTGTFLYHAKVGKYTH